MKTRTIRTVGLTWAATVAVAFSLVALTAGGGAAAAPAAPVRKTTKTLKKSWLQQALAAKEKMESSSPAGLPYVSTEYRRGTAPGKA